jgi:predicted acylesterase/phospholipase RssA/CRP-like cAMP-binding protein
LGDELPTALQSVDGFDGLPASVLQALGTEMQPVELAAGETLVRQGETGSGFCVVLRGSLGAHWRDRTGSIHALPDLTPGSIVGAASLLSDLPAVSTVEARGRATIARLSPDGFARFSDAHPDDARAIVEAVRPLAHRQSIRFALRQHGTLSDVEPGLLTALENELEPITLKGGDVLMRAGEPSDGVYVVVSGRLRVVTGLGTPEEQRLSEIGAGETIGEMALITGEPRSADVYAIRDTQLARLRQAAVERLLRQFPGGTLVMLARGPVQRLRAMNQGRPEVTPAATLALVPAATGVDLEAFAAAFVRALAPLGTVAHLNSQTVDAQFGRRGAAQTGGTADNALLIEWLARQELAHRFVLYQTDASPSAWTELAIRQADHIVLVANAGAEPGLNAIEREVLGAGVAPRTGRTLVLQHPAGTSPTNTTRWLSQRHLTRHLHLRAGRSEDFARVARLVTGHGVGLTLGGGFARGLAHIGVLRACRELNIPIDVLGGSSMGAMIAAQHLLGWDADRIVRDVCKGFSTSWDDITLPFLSFKRGGKSSKLLKSFFGEAQIEDLWLPFFCTSTNLNRAELKLHSAGPLYPAILATTRAPGVFPPVVIDGELHVDGGLINNVPVDIMLEVANHGVILGVDVSPPHKLGRVVDYGDNITGWQAIWHRFNPKREKRSYRPSILIVLMRLIEFGGISYRRRAAEHADVYIAPDLLHFKRNDFHRAAEIVETGYQAARAALTPWLATLATLEDRGRYRGLPLPPPPLAAEPG